MKGKSYSEGEELSGRGSVSKRGIFSVKGRE